MNTAKLFTCRTLAGLAAAGAALALAPAASAQTAASPFYSFTVQNLTSSYGSTAYPVLDSVTFASTQINEIFADGFTTTFPIGDAQNSVQAMDTMGSAPLMFSSTAPGVYSDSTHGQLTAATLTGTLVYPGFFPAPTLDLTVLTDSVGNSATQSVFTPFSASLFGPAPSGVAVGTFSLLNLGGFNNTVVDIDAAAVPAAVPEASTTVSLGLLLLGLGGVAVARRRAAVKSL